MEDIEIGEYVRTKKGYIGKWKQDIHNNRYYIDYNKKTTGYYSQEKIIKHSFNKIDLVEVGDYVNGKEVLDIYIPNDKWEPIEIRVDSKHISYYTKEDIKNIVTKEQFAKMQYDFEEE